MSCSRSESAAAYTLRALVSHRATETKIAFAAWLNASVEAENDPSPVARNRAARFFQEMRWAAEDLTQAEGALRAYLVQAPSCYVEAHPIDWNHSVKVGG